MLIHLPWSNVCCYLTVTDCYLDPCVIINEGPILNVAFTGKILTKGWYKELDNHLPSTLCRLYKTPQANKWAVDRYLWVLDLWVILHSDLYFKSHKIRVTKSVTQRHINTHTETEIRPVCAPDWSQTKLKVSCADAASSFHDLKHDSSSNTKWTFLESIVH